MDDDLLPDSDEPIVLGDEADTNQRINDELRDLVAAKMREQYDLDVDPDEFLVIERSGYVCVRL